MKRMQREGNEGEMSLIKMFGIRGLLAYLIGVIQGYIKGFSGDHRSVRLANKAFIYLTSAFAVMFIFVYIESTVIPMISKFQKNIDTEMDAAVAKAAEEKDKPVLNDAEETENLEQTPIETGQRPIQTKQEELPKKAEEEEPPEPLDDSVLEPSDVYAEKGSMAVFNAYHPKAQNYQWEIYDIASETWEKAPQEAVSEHEDELKRKVSSLELTADQEQGVRCQIDIEEDSPVSCEANLYILSGQISNISIDEFQTDAGTYVSAKDIPVEVTYQDGSKESVTGLNGLYFLEQSESSKDSTTAAGNMQETITTVRTAHEYDYISPGSKEGTLLYQGSKKNVDIPVNITGLDQTAPQITELTIGDFEVSNVDKEIPVTVTIKAEDNVTPLRHLVYAFLLEGETPQDGDWHDKAVFQTEITKNGLWTAYCKDEAGNVSTKEQELIVVDTKAPTIKLTLEKNVWCQDNTIFVSAEDNLSVEYRYLCEETGEDSGWIIESSKRVSKNGIWKIQVRDAVGNMAEKEITVDNIDTKAPVIRSITEKSEGETVSNEE